MENRQNARIGIVKIFSWYVAAIPILQYYISPLSALNLATLLSFVFLAAFILIILKRGKYAFEHLVTPMRWYVLFIAVNVIITSSKFGYDYSWSNLGAFIRLLFLFLSLIAVGNSFFNHNYAFNCMEKLLFISSIFIVIHLVLYIVFNVRFNPIIQPLVTTDSLNLDLNSPRSGGLYMEPAHYAQSATLYLCYRMFSRESPFRFDKKVVVIIIGIIASGSGQGYAMLALVYVLWILYNLFVEKASTKKIITTISSIVGIGILFVVLMQVPFIQSVVTRFMSLDSGVTTFGGQALAGRSYTNHYFHEFNSATKMTGIGFGHIADVTRGGFTNSLYSHLIQCGYPSIAFLAFILVYYFIKGDARVKNHCILYAIMITFTAMANPMMLCFFTQFYIGMCKDNEVNLGLRNNLEG